MTRSSRHSVATQAEGWDTLVDGEEKHVATLMSTAMTIEGRGFVD
jgi:hypothetical protein